MGEYPLFSRDEEIRLIERWQRCGDQRASTRLVQAHLRTVLWIAKRYRHYGVPLEELIAEGNLGMVVAISKFQPDRGTRFITYAAHWIRAQILAHLMRADSVVSTGRQRLRSRLFFRLRHERARLEGLYGPGWHAEELLARRLGVSRNVIASLLWQLDQRDVSLEGTQGRAIRGSRCLIPFRADCQTKKSSSLLPKRTSWSCSRRMRPCPSSNRASAMCSKTG